MSKRQMMNRQDAKCAGKEFLVLRRSLLVKIASSEFAFMNN
jgi:hypothetical protein